MGLYGGEEVDDRPSIMEYYHQDARTNQIYAKMAPTKAELAAKAEAEATKDLAEENAGESSSASPSLSPGPTLADDSSEGKRSYVDALKGSTSKPASTTKRTARLHLPSPKSEKEKVLAVFDEWQKDKVTKTRDDEIADIQEAIDASLAFQEATKPGRELPDVVDLTAYRTVEEMNDLEEALRVSKALAEEEDAEFRKAIEASMMDDDSAQPKQAPPPNTPDDKFREEPNFEAECGTGKDEEMVDPDADFQKATNTSTMNEPSPKRKRSGTRTPGNESTEYSVPKNSPHTPAKSMKSNADEETPRKIRRRIQRERVELEKALGSCDNGSGQGGNGAD